MPFEARYVEDTDSGCFLWTGAVSRGYGNYWCPETQRVVKAHRHAFERHFGAIPPGHVVRHKCDQPLCVNPAHLEAGTHSENMRDMVARGRHPSQRRRCRA